MFSSKIDLSCKLSILSKTVSQNLIKNKQKKITGLDKKIEVEKTFPNVVMADLFG